MCQGKEAGRPKWSLHTDFEPRAGFGVLSPLLPGFEARGVLSTVGVDVAGVVAEAACSEIEVCGCDDFAGDSGGIVADALDALDSAAGLGFARFREPMAQIEPARTREYPSYQCSRLGLSEHAVSLIVVALSELSVCVAPAAVLVGSSPVNVPRQYVRHSVIGLYQELLSSE